MSENNTALAGITVGVIGAGSMGGAIARGLVEAGAIEGSRVLVCDHNASKLEALAAEADVRVLATSDELLAEHPDVVVLAVEPPRSLVPFLPRARPRSPARSSSRSPLARRS